MVEGDVPVVGTRSFVLDAVADLSIDRLHIQVVLQLLLLLATSQRCH